MCIYADKHQAEDDRKQEDPEKYIGCECEGRIIFPEPDYHL
jgi:hypothetical protein